MSASGKCREAAIKTPGEKKKNNILVGPFKVLFLKRASAAKHLVHFTCALLAVELYCGADNFPPRWARFTKFYILLSVSSKKEKKEKGKHP